jgi:hypothetical protein
VSDAPKPNAFLDAQDALLLLRSRTLSVGLIRRIAATPDWVRNDRVRAALVLHPRTPRPLAMALLPQLRWRDLVRVTATAGCAAPLVLGAERLLADRLADLALGERIVLARAASENLLKTLRREASPLVVKALLENPRFRPEDAVFIAERAESAPEALRVLAESPRWRGRADLRRAIAAHPSTPPQAALRIVAAMDGVEIGRLLESRGATPLVRLAAERRLQGLLGGTD